MTVRSYNSLLTKSSAIPKFLISAGFILMFLASSSASALNTLSLSPSTSVTEVGEFISVDLNMDFSSQMQGGGIEVYFDNSVLSYQSFTWASDLYDDAYLRCWPQTATDYCNELSAPPKLELGWGVLLNDLLTGPHLIGTIVFEAIGQGESALNLLESLNFPGQFYDGNGSLIAPELVGAHVSVGATTVPEPATALFLGMGLVALSIGSRRS
ncbi:MAG: cohesin domain-containing protein [Myxococcota bacterium]|nr:cohesin domain-containing protein [Myxococcota bacterium]